MVYGYLMQNLMVYGYLMQKFNSVQFLKKIVMEHFCQ